MQPIQRLTVSIHDALLSYARAGKRRKKILGAWKGYKGPKSVETPLFHVGRLCVFTSYKS